MTSVGATGSPLKVARPGLRRAARVVRGLAAAAELVRPGPVQRVVGALRAAASQASTVARSALLRIRSLSARSSCEAAGSSESVPSLRTLDGPPELFVTAARAPGVSARDWRDWVAAASKVAPA